MSQLEERFRTPEHAAPEQIRNQQVTTATDVYTLGNLLYELLTDTLPFRRTTSAFELEKQICSEEPPRPSSVLALRSARDAKRVRGDLDSIVLKALRKVPAERYASAERLSADIDNFLRGTVVEARRGSVLYRMRRTIRQYWGVLAIGMALMVAGVGAPFWIDGRSKERERDAWIEKVRIAGLSLHARGLYREARELLLDQVLYVKRFVAPSGTPGDVLVAFRDAARVLYEEGKLDEAESMLREAVAHGRQSGSEGPELADVLAVLAAVRREQGQWTESEGLYREALALRAQVPERDPVTPGLEQCGLGSLLASDGFASDAALPEAEQRITRCLATGREALDAHDPRTADAIAAMAGLRARQKRFAESIDLYREAIALDRQLFRGGHPQTATHLLALVRILIMSAPQPELAEAEVMAREALALRRRFFPSEAWRVTEAENVWGAALNRLGRTAEAVPILQRTWASLIQRPGPKAEVTIRAFRGSADPVH